MDHLYAFIISRKFITIFFKWIYYIYIKILNVFLQLLQIIVRERKIFKKILNSLVYLC